MKIGLYILTGIIALCSVPASAQTITHKGNRMGLNDSEGNLLLQPIYDTVFKPIKDLRFFVAGYNGKYAYATKSDLKDATWLKSEPVYDKIYSLNLRKTGNYVEVSEYLILVQGEKKGSVVIELFQDASASLLDSWYIRSVGRINVLPAEFDDIRLNKLASEAFVTLIKDKKYGLSVSFDHTILPEYDKELYFCGNHRFLAQKNEMMGMLLEESTGIKEDIPFQYASLKYIGGGMFQSNTPGEKLIIFNRTTGKTISPADASGNPLVNPPKNTPDFRFFCVHSKKNSDDFCYDNDNVLHIQRWEKGMPEWFPTQSATDALYVYDRSSGNLKLEFKNSGFVYSWLDEDVLMECDRPDKPRKTKCTFYYMPSGEKLFSIKVKPGWKVIMGEKSVSEKIWKVVHLTRHGKGRDKMKGYYNMQTKKYHRLFKI
ncbi:hypothetical protein D3C87_396440 [compost metagenome]